MFGLSSVAIGEAEIGPEMGGLVESGDGAVELAIVGVRRAGLDLRRDRRSAGAPAERGLGLVSHPLLRLRHHPSG